MRTIVAVLLSLLACGTASAASPEPDALTRGEYLVERVGMCADCHSPRDETGRFIPSQWLGGSPIGFAPKHKMPNWAEAAPPLAGLPEGYTQTQLAAFLETGRRQDGSEPRPPMPPYRFSRTDAEAVAAYLASLRSK